MQGTEVQKLCIQQVLVYMYIRNQEKTHSYNVRAWQQTHLCYFTAYYVLSVYSVDIYSVDVRHHEVLKAFNAER